MKIDHIGYAVKSIEKAIDSFKELGYSFDNPINDIQRNVILVFGSNSNYHIELVSPLDKALPSPVDTYLSASVGTPYHICYKSPDLDKDIAKLEMRGFKTIIKPMPAIAFSGRRVAFMINIGFGLMEIVEE